MSINHQDFFVIRTPRMPLDIFQTLGDDRQQTKTAIENWLQIPGVKEAIYFASPSLLERTEQLSDKKENTAQTAKQKKSFIKQQKKLEQALLKYLIRMCSRPTPFGLFSGISLGELGGSTQLIPDTLSNDSRKTRLDFFFLSAVKDYILENSYNSQELNYIPNPTHYFIGEKFRYIEAYQSNKSRQYRLSSIDTDEYFLSIMKIAEKGMSFAAIIGEFLKLYKNTDKEEIVGYVKQLIDEKVLIADMKLPLTGESPDKSFVESLYSAGAMEVAEPLSTAIHQLQTLDQKQETNITDYKDIVNQLKKLPVETEENRLFQTDIYRSFSKCQLDKSQLNQLLKKIILLVKLKKFKSSPFEDFIRKFNQRYEGQFVRLDNILDEESGIGFSYETGYESQLLAGLQLKGQPNSSSLPPSASKLDRLITQAISLPENRNKSVIQLSSIELSKHTDSSNIESELPASFAALISLYEDANNELLINFHGCSGPSAATTLGRFCHLDTRLKEKLINHLENESSHSAGVIYAEIVHMPEGRPGNVIARPHLREYEIVFLADSNLSSEYQITLRDLYVWIENGQVKLWSKRLDKQVVPRLSSAHNYTSRSLSAYRFLSTLQNQETSLPNFSLPSSQVSTSFVPRIMLDNLILSEKAWRIPRKEIVNILKDSKIVTEKWNSLKTKYQLDDVMAYQVHDNVLQLDLRNAIMLEILLAETKGLEIIELKEVLSSIYSSPVKSTDGKGFANELVIPFFNSGAKVHSHLTKNPLANINSNPIKRRFSPGSQWLSLKVYSGNTTIDSLLARSILPFLEENSSLYKKWFFIRYGDPDWHIRLRFYGEKANLYGKLLPALNQLLDPMVENGEIHKTELFTYEREVERYGGPDAMELAENLFMADSLLVAQTIRYESELTEDLRWRISLLKTDKLLSSFKVSGSEKLSLISKLRKSFGEEFGESGPLRKQLGEKYKSVQKQLEEDFVLLNSHKKGGEPHHIYQLVNHWFSKVEKHIEQFNLLIDNDKVTCGRDSLIGSLLHMHNNRMFKAYGRQHELVMHDFMRRYYLSNNKKRESAG